MAAHRPGEDDLSDFAGALEYIARSRAQNFAYVSQGCSAQQPLCSSAPRNVKFLRRPARLSAQPRRQWGSAAVERAAPAPLTHHEAHALREQASANRAREAKLIRRYLERQQLDQGEGDSAERALALSACR